MFIWGAERDRETARSLQQTHDCDAGELYNCLRVQRHIHFYGHAVLCMGANRDAAQLEWTVLLVSWTLLIRD